MGEAKKVYWHEHTFRELAEIMYPRAIVVNVLWIGVAPHNMCKPFPGTITLTAETYMRVLSETVESLLKHGVKRVVFLNGHGGNMDLPDVCSGSTVFLPVFHEEALLYIGDAHAVQGDGEISGTAVEMLAEVKIKVDVKDEPLGWPMIENKDEVMFVSTTRNGASLENAIRTAFLELALWIEKKFDLNRFDALMLCSQIGKIRIGNLWTAAAKIEKKYLEALMVR